MLPPRPAGREAATPAVTPSSATALIADSPRRRLAWLLPAWLAGGALRLWNLRDQLPLGDELHAVRAALLRPLSEVLVTYQVTDHSIPLTAIDRLLIEAGLGLSELLLRLPALLAGLALLAAAPWWLWRRLGSRTAVVLAWLLALSPGLVIYSRIARSYAPMVLCCAVAVAAFEAWWRRPGWRPGALVAISAATAVWLHLGAAALMASPFAVATVAALRRRNGRQLRALGALAAGTAAAVAAWLLPALPTLLPVLAGKQGAPRIGWERAGEVLCLLAGSASPWPAMVFWGAVITGAVLLARRDRILGALAVLAPLGQLAGILALAPMGHQAPMILHRYLLPGLPFLLLAAAVALARLPATLAAAGLVLLGLAGPFVDPTRWRSSFTHHVDFVDFVTPRPQLGPRQLPLFYRQLDDPARRGPLLELPFHPTSPHTRALHLYQDRHRQRVLGVPLPGPLIDPRLRWRNLIPARPPAVLASPARWLVVHRDLGREERELASTRMQPQHRAVLRRAARTAAQRFERAWGPPDHVDRVVLAWDLAALRRGSSAAYASPAARPASTASARIEPRVSTVAAPSAAEAAAGSPK